MTAIQFRGKSAASSDKLRGGYYTPESIAKFLATWVGKAGSRLLEPSCGDGQILRFLAVAGKKAKGIELVSEEADKARRYGPVDNCDFFSWPELASTTGAWDGIAGNPPYIRFGNWPSDLRESALQVMKHEGLRASKLTNAWVPFVVAATTLVRSGGRVGLVLPAELLQVGYAAELRDYLVKNYKSIELVTFKRLVFAGVLQEVVLFLGTKGGGPAQIGTVDLESTDDLSDSWRETSSAPSLEHDHEKWTKYYLSAAQISILRELRLSDESRRLGKFAQVDVGVVTGRNSFFTMTSQEVASRDLAKHCRSLVSRSAQLRGLYYEKELLDEDRSSAVRTWLLDASPESVDEPLLRYVADGEQEGVHLGYKCSLRKPWWSTPRAWVPDAFLLRQIHRAPRLVANFTDATCTDTVHRVKLIGSVSAEDLAVSTNNSLTFAYAEILGRSYGGGVLELEPREAEALPLADPIHVPEGLSDEVDRLILTGEAAKSIDLVDDEVLVRGMGLSRATVESCRSAWLTLSGRRNARGRGKRV